MGAAFCQLTHAAPHQVWLTVAEGRRKHTQTHIYTERERETSRLFKWFKLWQFGKPKLPYAVMVAYKQSGVQYRPLSELHYSSEGPLTVTVSKVAAFCFSSPPIGEEPKGGFDACLMTHTYVLYTVTPPRVHTLNSLVVM